MRRFLVLSDTHNERTLMDIAVKKAGQTDAIIHLGDNIADAKYLKNTGKTVYSVKGNCDFNEVAQTEILLNIAGKKIFITHGHKYGVKYSLERILYRTSELQADAVFFGHTHAAFNSYEQGILMLNPGSLAEPRLKKRTFAVVEIENGTIRAILKSV